MLTVVNKPLNSIIPLRVLLGSGFAIIKNLS